MAMGRGRSTLTHFYSLCGEILESVDEAKYLGINISHELSWSPPTPAPQPPTPTTTPPPHPTPPHPHPTHPVGVILLLASCEEISAGALLSWKNSLILPYLDQD